MSAAILFHDTTVLPSLWALLESRPRHTWSNALLFMILLHLWTRLRVTFCKINLGKKGLNWAYGSRVTENITAWKVESGKACFHPHVGTRVRPGSGVRPWKQPRTDFISKTLLPKGSRPCNLPKQHRQLGMQCQVHELLGDTSTTPSSVRRQTLTLSECTVFAILWIN